LQRGSGLPNAFFESPAVLISGNLAASFFGDHKDDYEGEALKACPESCEEFGCVVHEGSSENADCEWHNPKFEWYNPIKLTYGYSHELCKKCCCPEGSKKCEEDADAKEAE